MQNSLQLKENSDAAVIVLHEIYGINPHMHSVCHLYYSLGFDVYCPNLTDTLEHFSYDQQEKAYAHFVENVGFGVNKLINAMVITLRNQYKYIFLMGFSVGATLAWISSSNKLIDGVVCYYGSRIRNYPSVTPSCPVLLLFAKHEVAFCPEKLLQELSILPNVRGKILEAEHGFCDPFSPSYNVLATKKAEYFVQDFLLHIRID